MRYILYSLATIALVASGSTTDSTVTSPPMANAAQIPGPGTSAQAMPGTQTLTGGGSPSVPQIPSAGSTLAPLATGPASPTTAAPIDTTAGPASTTTSSPDTTPSSSSGSTTSSPATTTTSPDSTTTTSSPDSITTTSSPDSTTSSPAAATTPAPDASSSSSGMGMDASSSASSSSGSASSSSSSSSSDSASSSSSDSSSGSSSSSSSSSSTGSAKGLNDGNNGDSNTNTNVNININTVTNINTLFTGVNTVVGSNWIVTIPTTVIGWDTTPVNRYGPLYGAGTVVYPAPPVQTWWQYGQRYSWSLLPLIANPDWTFTSELRTCILQGIEHQVQLYDGSILPGWLVPVSTGVTQYATDIAWGTLETAPHYNWLSWVLPWGAPGSQIITTEAFVSPFLNILQSPELYTYINAQCTIPAANFTLINKKIEYTDNSWAVADSTNANANTNTNAGDKSYTAPVFGSAAPSLLSSSSFHIIALPLLSMVALLFRV